MSSSLCLHQLLQGHFKLCGRKCLWSYYDVIAACASIHRGKLRKESVLPRSELGTCRIQFCSVTVAQSCSVGSTDCEVTLSRGVGLTTHPHLAPRLPLLPLWAFAACCRLNFTVSAVYDCAIGIFLLLMFWVLMYYLVCISRGVLVLYFMWYTSTKSSQQEPENHVYKGIQEAVSDMPRSIYYYYYYYYYYLLQLSFHSVAVVLTLVTNKNKYT